MRNDQYKDDIAAFYRDVYIVFDNTSTYNAVNSAICESAFRLSFVFERLFYEIVLDYHNNLSNNNFENYMNDMLRANLNSNLNLNLNLNYLNLNLNLK